MIQRAFVLHDAGACAGPVAEQVLLLENIGTSLHVGPNQLPSLHKLLVQASATLQMATPPDLYVRQHPSPNAYTLAISGRKPFVVGPLLEPLPSSTCLELVDASLAAPAIWS